ncbi:MAG: hypothetical protein ACHBN1_11655 [Heteroscytonema crispum UTEX LB 1556]
MQKSTMAVGVYTPGAGARLKNEIGLALGQQLNEEKTAGRPVKLVRMRVATGEGCFLGS